MNLHIRSLPVEYGFTKPPRMHTVVNKAKISFLTNSFINTLANYLRRVKKPVFTGVVFGGLSGMHAT